MEVDKPRRTVSEKIKQKLGSITGQGVNTETGRSWAEERMIAAMHERGGDAFNIARSAETRIKNYKRSDKQ